MTERVYRFDMVCPRCGKTNMTTMRRRVPSPPINCGYCFERDESNVELKIVTVTVENE